MKSELLQPQMWIRPLWVIGTPGNGKVDKHWIVIGGTGTVSWTRIKVFYSWHRLQKTCLYQISRRTSIWTDHISGGSITIGLFGRSGMKSSQQWHWGISSWNCKRVPMCVKYWWPPISFTLPIQSSFIKEDKSFYLFGGVHEHSNITAHD